MSESNQSRQLRQSRLLMLLTVFIFSFGGLMIKFVPWSGMAIVGGRCGIAAIAYFVYMRVIRHRIVINKPTIIGSLSVCLDLTLYVCATKLTTAANAIVLENTAPIFVILLSWLLYRKKPTVKQLLTCLVVFAGVCVFFMDSLSSGNMLGNALALAAGFFYSGMMLLGTIEGCDSKSAFFFGFVLAAIVGLPFTAQMTDFSFAAIGGILFLGLIQVAAAYILFDAAIQHLPPVETSLLCSLEPILNTLLVAVFYGEMMTPLAMVAGVVIVAAVAWYSYREAKAGN